MTTLDQKIIDGATLAAQKLNISGVTPHFIASWWVSENGWDFPNTNNVGNISYSGSGIPSGGNFQGVTSVNSNKTVNYDSWQDGVAAFVHLLSTPKSNKALTIDSTDLAACNGDAAKMAEVVGESNWAESRYNDGKGPGSAILDVYNSPSMIAAFKDSTPVKQASIAITPSIKEGHAIHVIASGEVLSRIAAKFNVPLGILARYNSIEDPDKIQAGEKLIIPKSIEVRSGDTVSEIARRFNDSISVIGHVNGLDSNTYKIFVGQTLWV
jgi:LysM repeat protein